MVDLDQYLRAITHLHYLTFALHAWLHITAFHQKMYRQHAKRHFLIEKSEKEVDNQGSFLRFYRWTSLLKWQVWCNGSFNFLEPDEVTKLVHYFCWESRSLRSFAIRLVIYWLGDFPKWKRNSENSANSGNLINHWSMSLAQFRDLVSHMCLAGAVVASWSLTQEAACSNPFTVVTNIFVTQFSENI